MGDDAWMMFSEMCRRVVEDENCYLQVYIAPTGLVGMTLYPLGDDWEDEDE